jgi:hypothetical protein
MGVLDMRVHRSARVLPATLQAGLLDWTRQGLLHRPPSYTPRRPVTSGHFSRGKYAEVNVACRL